MSGKIHLIGSAHLDPVWLWTYEEGLAEIKATFQSALDRLDEFDDFVFTCSSAAYYKWIEKNEPVMFEKICKRIKEGRWVPIGGWWVQADCNLPSGESFARHSLYSQRYYKEKFGLTCVTGYSVDSFGHNAMLPQLLRQAGMKSYVFMRPEDHEYKLPYRLFRWRSPDGSEVTAYHIAQGYACVCGEKEKLERIEAMEELKEYSLMLFYGVGNHGGGPTIQNIRCLLEEQGKRNGRLLFSSPDTYFQEVEQSVHGLPVLSGSLRHHSPGCYTAHSEIKKQNRLAESNLVSAESWCALAHMEMGTSYPKAKFQEAWEILLFHQFHDILAGCCIREACEDTRDAIGSVCYTASQLQNAAIQSLTWNIDTFGGASSPVDKQTDWQLWYPQGRGVPIVVLNVLPFERECEVEVNAYLNKVEYPEGRSCDLQIIRAGRTDRNKKWNTLFRAKIPAFGYQLFWGFQDTGELPEKEFRFFHPEKPPVLKNKWLYIEFDPISGAIASIQFNNRSQEFIDVPGCQAILIDETESDTWGHGIRSYHKEIGRFSHARFLWVENGPVRQILRVETSCSQSVLTQDFILGADSDFVRVRCRLDFHEKHRMLKLSFPLRGTSPRCIASLPFGWEQRPCDGTEDISQKWTAILGTAEESGEDIGLILINDCKYGFSAQNADLRMSVARGAVYADHYGVRDELCEHMDQGEQEFQYILIPFCGQLKGEKADRLAQELHSPVISVLETYHHGRLPEKLSGIKLSDNRISISAFKLSENGDGYILRCYETSGTSSKVPVDISLLSIKKGFSTCFGAFEIKSIYFPIGDAPAYEVNFMEWKEGNGHGG